MFKDTNKKALNRYANVLILVLVAMIFAPFVLSQNVTPHIAKNDTNSSNLTDEISLNIKKDVFHFENSPDIKNKDSEDFVNDTNSSLMIKSNGTINGTGELNISLNVTGNLTGNSSNNSSINLNNLTINNSNLSNPEGGLVFADDISDVNVDLLDSSDKIVVVEKKSIKDYYSVIDIGAPSEKLEVDLSKINWGNTKIDEPIILTQTMTVKNKGQEKINKLVDIFDYNDKISINLEEVDSIRIYEGEEIVSDRSIFISDMKPGDSKKFKIEYLLNPIQKEILCSAKTIKDFLPKDAIVKEESKKLLGEVIGKTCKLRIYHEGEMPYFDVKLTLNDVDATDLKSAHFSEDNEHLGSKDNVIILPE